MSLLIDKICLVTGTSRGIGRATAKLFAENGAIVLANARKKDALDSLIDECKGFHGRIVPLCFDITDGNALNQVFTDIFKVYKKLDIVVNNAGIMKDALIGMVSHDLLKELFEINVFAVINIIQYAKKIMSRQKSGSIINLASIVGENGNSGQIAYSATKGAVSALTKTAAKELAEFNIRVNAIAPGMIDTDMFNSIGEKKVAESLAKIKFGRLGTPLEIANAALFLASDLSSYISGQILGVNGIAII